MSQQMPAEPDPGAVTYPTMTLPAGETIFEQGDKGASMYLIQEGQVELLQGIGDQLARSAVLEKGDFFGEMSLFDEASRNYSIRTLSAVRLVKIDRRLFQHMLRRNPEIAIRMIRKLAGRLSQAEERLLASYCQTQPEEKLNRPGYGQLTHRGDSGAVFILPDRPTALVGRLDPTQGLLPDIDLTAIDPQVSTSRRHARILSQEGQFSIVGERATNGTFVNGRRLDPDQPQPIQSGDEISFGAVQMVFSIDPGRAE